MQCSSCGSVVPDDARFCPTCGTQQSGGEEERRVVTALFADIVGFTSLAEKLDPEEVKHLIDRCFERLARDITSFGGVVDKVLGDGIVALFGAPVAHEDDAERAVRAGLRMQQSILAFNSDVGSSMAMRIGINTGEVLVGVSSAGGDYTAMGDVMNSASRLEAHAEPGQVIVGPATHAATSDAISYRALGRLAARGRDPIEAWRALNAVRPPGARTRRATHFIGRKRELDLLLAQARLAFGTRRAQATLILGEAGIGKTRLVEEAAGSLAGMFGARVLEGRSVPYGEANVWWPMAELVRRAYNMTSETPPDEAETAIRAGLVGHLGDGRTEEIERYTIALLHALGYQTHLRGGDRTRNRDEVSLAVTTVLQRELEQRPVVLIMSDIHWAAEAVIDLLSRMLTDLARHPLVIMMTARTEEVPDLLHGRHGSLVLHLGPLDIAAGRDLVAELGVELPDDVAAGLVERSGGNPFFLEELASLVTDHGGEPQTETVAALASGSLQGLPDTLRGIVSARLDALDPRSRTVLEAAAVLGSSGTVGGLAQMMQETQGWTDIGPDLDELDRAELLTITGSRFGFRSEMVRDVAYGTLTKTARANLHQGIAAFLEDEMLNSGVLRNSRIVAIAHHFHAAATLATELNDAGGLDRQAVEAKALEWSLEAGERALAAGVPTEAVTWFTNGLVVASDDLARARLYYGRGRANSEIRALRDARADLEMADSIEHDDPVLRACTLLERGEVDRKNGELDRAADRLGQASSALSELKAYSQQSLALRLLGLAETFRGNLGAAKAAFMESRDVAAAVGDRRAEAWTLQSLAWFWLRSGRLDEASALVQEADAIFTELDDRGGVAWTRGVEAWVAFHSGDRVRAASLVTEVLPDIQRRGDPWAEAVLVGLLASIELWSGRADHSRELAEQSRQLALRAEESGLLIDARLIEGRALVSRGRVAEGTAVLEEAYATAGSLGDRESIRRTVVSNCSSAARLGEPERAIRWAARYDADLSDHGVLGDRDLIVSLALALLQRGAVHEAMSQLELLISAGAPGAESVLHPTETYANAVGALLAAAAGQPELGLQRADRILASNGSYLDRVFAHLARAAIGVQTGHRADADSALGDARRELAETDDRVTPLLVELADGVFSETDSGPIESALLGLGIDPTGWLRALRCAVDPTLVTG